MPADSNSGAQAQFASAQYHATRGLVAINDAVADGVATSEAMLLLIDESRAALQFYVLSGAGEEANAYKVDVLSALGQFPSEVADPSIAEIHAAMSRAQAARDNALNPAPPVSPPNPELEASAQLAALSTKIESIETSLAEAKVNAAAVQTAINSLVAGG